MPKVVYEIFPVTLHNGRILLLQRDEGVVPAAWHVPCDRVTHPSLAVSREVAARFGPALDRQPSVLHSTWKAALRTRLPMPAGYPRAWARKVAAASLDHVP